MRRACPLPSETLQRLSQGYGVRLPGQAKAEARTRAEREGIEVPRPVHDAIAGRIGAAAGLRDRV